MQWIEKISGAATLLLKQLQIALGAKIVIAINDDICLAPIVASDADTLVSYLNSPEIMRNSLSHSGEYTRSDAMRWISIANAHEDLFKPTRDFAIRKLDSGKMIGAVNLLMKESSYNRHLAELGYWIGEEYWGNGYMTDTIGAFTTWTFENLPVKKIVATTFEENTASARVLEKNGYEQEGFLKENIYKSGIYIDCKLYGLTRTHHENLNRNQNI